MQQGGERRFVGQDMALWTGRTGACLSEKSKDMSILGKLALVAEPRILESIIFVGKIVG